MKKGIIFKICGLFFLATGVLILFNSFRSITGFVIFGNANINKGYYIGIWFILSGLLLASYRKNKKQEDNQESKKI